MKVSTIIAGTLGLIAFGLLLSFLLSWPVMALWNGTRDHLVAGLGYFYALQFLV